MGRRRSAVDDLDGLSVEFPTWRFNVRMSNTEPVVRVNVETRGDKELLLSKTEEVLRASGRHVMRIALAQINPTVGDLRATRSCIVESGATRPCRRARAVVAFPELAICGYPPEDLVLKDYFLADCRDALRREVARPACPDIVALVGVPLRENGAVYNAVAVLAGG